VSRMSYELLRTRQMADTIRRYQKNTKALINRARKAEDALRRANLEIERLKDTRCPSPGDLMCEKHKIYGCTLCLW
jgi:hypothetical protein